MKELKSAQTRGTPLQPTPYVALPEGVSVALGVEVVLGSAARMALHVLYKVAGRNATP